MGEVVRGRRDKRGGKREVARGRWRERQREGDETRKGGSEREVVSEDSAE